MVAVMSLSDVFSYTAFVHAVAGTAGGSAAMTLFYPLDALRSVLQVSNKNESTIETITRMLREEGAPTPFKIPLDLPLLLPSSFFALFFPFSSSFLLYFLIILLTRIRYD